MGVRTRDSIRTILGTTILEFGDEWLRGYSLQGNRIWRVSLLFVFCLRFWQVWLFQGPAGLYENFSSCLFVRWTPHAAIVVEHEYTRIRIKFP